MPIYEFYCADCHTVYSFFSRKINTEKRPDCPRCGRPQLERRVSRFAIGRGGSDKSEKGEGGQEDDDLLPPGFDEEKFERAMMELASEAENLDEEDPRQMARLMRKLSQSTGLEFGGAMEEAIRRLEAGEDPESIEEDLGDLLEEEEPIFQQTGRSLKTIVQHLLPPKKEETLYDLDAAPSTDPASSDAHKEVAAPVKKTTKRAAKKASGTKSAQSATAKRRKKS
ncbi:FmdB family zinc ribbon protein [Thermogutta sp.]|uniref:FmdB family zinc ribbon protein n=1 Tax=Thermogutta sp. TaxID=1962930 RepID=UPI003C7D94EB